MARLVILGTASAVSDARHDNTHMVLDGVDGAIMIDCASNPLARLDQAGISRDRLQHLITTHFHPDHVYGVPILFMNLWLTGRHGPLAVYGLHHCLERIEHLMEDFGWSEWPNFFPVSFHRLPEREGVLVLDNADFRITCSPSVHLVPTIGLRILIKESGRVLAYSSDTAPCDSVARLVRNADVLIHEAAGLGIGHSSAEQAGLVARNAEVGKLILVHYPVTADPAELEAEARRNYDGPVIVPQDFQGFDL
jgi:ribonuclease Z